MRLDPSAPARLSLWPAIAALGLIGCSLDSPHMFDGKDLAKSLEANLTRLGIDVEVTCPTLIKGKTGTPVTCTAPAQNGELRWTGEIDGKNVRVDSKQMVVDFNHAENLMLGLWKERSSLPIEVNCTGLPVIMIKDDTFSCSVTVGAGDELIGTARVVDEKLGKIYATLEAPQGSPHADVLASIPANQFEADVREAFEPFGGITDLKCPQDPPKSAYECTGKLGEHPLALEVDVVEGGRRLWRFPGRIINVENQEADTGSQLSQLFYQRLDVECGSGHRPVLHGESMACTLTMENGRQLPVPHDYTIIDGELGGTVRWPGPMEPVAAKREAGQQATKEKRHADARRELRDALRSWEKFTRAPDRFSAWIHHDLGEVDKSEEKWRQAAKRYSKSLALLEKNAGTADDISHLQWDIAQILWTDNPTSKEQTRALKLARKALASARDADNTERAGKIQAWLDARATEQ